MQSHNYSVQRDDTDNLFWVNQFQELLEYKKQYGHNNVPSIYGNQTLFQWINQQRDDYAKLNMSDERINMLNAINFDWTKTQEDSRKLKTHNNNCHGEFEAHRQNELTKFKDKLWNDKFEQLKIYKSKHGHCNVPKNYDKNQSLVNWVKRQRNQFKHSKLSEERIKMLNAIGFNWSIPKDSFWIVKFEELKIYKSKHGHCNVPQKYDENQPLAYWVHKQRNQIKHSKLSEERINMLNTIGFNWSISKDSIWNDKFEQLKQYKSKYGDCNVPWKYDKNQPLANWVQTQRSQCKHSKLSEERINMLNTIGFSWTTPKRMDKPRLLKNHEQIVIETSYKDSNEKEEQSEKEDSDIKEYHEQIAIETSYQDAKETETTTEEKEEKSFKRSLQDRVQVLCTISMMFQEQKDAIHADMKRRKLGNSA